MYPLTIGLVIESKKLWEDVQAAIQDLPVRVVVEQQEIGPWPEFLDKIQRVRPDVLLLEMARVRDTFPEVVRNIKSTPAPPQIVAVDSSADPETILAAIRAGANEFLYPPLSTSLRDAFERLSGGRGKQRGDSQHPSKTIAFLSAKGGCGATTIACHIAVELQRQTKLEVLLADLDLHAGMVGFLMKAKSPYSVLDAVKNIQRLDLSFWKALVSNGIPGLKVMAAPSTFSYEEPPSCEQIRHVLRFVRTEYDWTVLDLGRSLSPLTRGALDDVDQAFLVTTLEVPALHQVKGITQKLVESGFDQNKLHLILNRMPKNPEISPDELEKMLGLTLYATLPNDYPGLYQSYAEGTLLPANSRLARHFVQLAAKIAGTPEEKEVKRKFPFFGKENSNGRQLRQ